MNQESDATFIIVAKPRVASVLLPVDVVPAKNIDAEDESVKVPLPLLIIVIVVPIGKATTEFNGIVIVAAAPV